MFRRRKQQLKVDEKKHMKQIPIGHVSPSWFRLIAERMECRRVAGVADQGKAYRQPIRPTFRHGCAFAPA